MRQGSRLQHVVLVLVSCCALATCGDDSSSPVDAAGPKVFDAGAGGVVIGIKTLGNRADFISGGEAYIELNVPAVATSATPHVTVGSRDVSSAFAARADGRVKGLITGLADGANVVSADIGGSFAAKLTITNHPIGGPVFSGSQIQPWVCATPIATPASGDMAATNASGLGTAAIDAQCNIATEIKLYYRSTTAGCSTALPDPNPPTAPPASPCFKPYDPGAAAAPADLAMTTTDAGATVPYIVRVERGTLNRGIHDIAVLFDPTKDDPTTGWKPYAPQSGWNGKLVYSFGASTGQPRRQFRSEQSWTDDAALSRGFMVAISSMTDSLYNSNRVSMSETVMMMKEHIIDTYGELKYTVGNGCSGGSINQLTTASIYPGLLDGIQPSCTYPDSETTAIEVADCDLLVRFYNDASWATLMGGKTQAEINAKKTAINGHRDQSGCHAWVNLFASVGRPGNFIPTIVVDNNTGATAPAAGGLRNNCQLPLSLVYDPTSNPDGLRCSGADHAVALWGKVPGENRARDTRDNVGVQYGLKALTSAAITPEEFVTLNEKIGGTDADANPSASRTAADAEALAIAYKAGIVSDGRHLAKTAIIDLRGWDDSAIPPPPGLGIHHIWRSFELRARLDADHGNHDNHVMWRYGTGLIAPAASQLTMQSFLTMDKWLTDLKADTASASLEQKIVSHKPAEAFDFCFLTSDTTFMTKVTDFDACAADPLLQPHTSPRQVAGGPLAENVLKCQLKPLDAADYTPAVLTSDQLDRLRAVFPGGVCDFSKPGVGQQAAVSPLDFSAGPGGTPFPAAPTSTAL